MKYLRLSIAALGVALVASGCGPSPASVGGPMPEFAVESMAKPGAMVGNGELKGKVLLIDFWATWCGPCRESMPAIRAIAEKYKGKEFAVLGISDEARNVVNRFDLDQKPGYPLFIDTSGKTQHAFEVNALPTTVVVGKDGTILYREEGYGPGVKEKLEAAIDKALGG